MRSSHLSRSNAPDSRSKQDRGDSEERALYLQFCNTLQSLIALIDRFGRMTPEIQRELQEAYPILATWDEPRRQDLRMKLETMIEDLEGLADCCLTKGRVLTLDIREADNKGKVCYVMSKVKTRRFCVGPQDMSSP
jgi:hypothetical protein